MNGASPPVFRYFKRDGAELQTTGADANTGTDFRDCVRTVQIRLVVLPEARSTKPIDVTTRVALRNYNEVSAC